MLGYLGLLQPVPKPLCPLQGLTPYQVTLCVRGGLGVRFLPSLALPCPPLFIMSTLARPFLLAEHLACLLPLAHFVNGQVGGRASTTPGGPRSASSPSSPPPWGELCCSSSPWSTILAFNPEVPVTCQTP